ncbi:hypothetical protein K461DRAFT_293302 [Myriangium duriaei CBS 260.36]|uniref:Tyrosine specific protein phosphatases domain-containing protein n=1 Tax=Myriangium duriaei CBS 260.36 TaxID=1168546 RepID=A0A9P4J0L6_9PEZI|nr:hypothetical protein K461DRAFT_293302 [Myriangium duriaei CBS 260.36]
MSATTEPPKAPSNLPPPFHNIDGIANFRDIGGLPTTSSPTHKVKQGILFRSADPSNVSSQGLSQLHALNITTVFDLRSEPEIKRQGKEWDGTAIKAPFVDAEKARGNQIARHWTPVFAQTDASPAALAMRYKAYTEEGAGGFVKAYGDILDNGGNAYGAVLRHLAEEKEGACLVHCTAGKDRTGVLVAILLLLLGVGEEEVAREYSLTNKGLEHLREFYVERLLRTEVLKGDREGVERMITSREESMRGTIGMVKERWGGAEGYVRDVVGLTDEEIGGLRRRFGVEA